MIGFSHHSEANSVWRWPNFTTSEMGSTREYWFRGIKMAEGDGSLLLNFEFMDALQLLRNMMGAPLVINSAYRDPIYNAAIGGAPMSQHKFGKAADIALYNHNRHVLLEKARQAGFTGFGFYNTFLHVDTGPKRSWGKWK